jgi:hypothetical protein
MTNIVLGIFELIDSKGFRVEGDFSFQKYSQIPDIIVRITDELAPPIPNLVKDSAFLTSIEEGLKSFGFKGEVPKQLSVDGNRIVLEANSDVVTFASENGWVDTAINKAGGKRDSLLSVLEDDASSIVQIDEDRFDVAGVKYLVIDYGALTEEIKNGVIVNLRKIDTAILAKHASAKLSDSFEERKKLIEQQKLVLDTARDFSEWILQFISADNSFYRALAQTLSKDELYSLAFGANLLGKTEDFAIFSLS